MFLRQSDLQTVLADDNIEKGDTVHHFIQVTNGISLLTQNHFYLTSSLKKSTFSIWLIIKFLCLCVTYFWVTRKFF